MIALSAINKSILKLTIPNIVTNITVPLLGIVDIALMGRLNNPIYIGAIAIGSLIFNMIYSGFSFLRMGSSGMTAQAFGAKLPTEISLVLIRSLIVAMGLAIILIVFQFPIQWISFKLLDTSDSVALLAISYFKIRIWAAPATLGLYAFFGWFLGMQNAKYPMIVAITINIINIVLNFAFVYGLKMTSDGVALSTVIAQYSGLLLSIYFLLKKYKIFLVKLPIKIILQKQAIFKFFKVNSDIFIRTILLLLTLSFFTNISSKSGDNILAINTILLQFFFIFSYFADGFAYAGEALTGKYFGLQNKTALGKTISYLFYWGWAIAIASSLLFYLGFSQFLRLMTDNQHLHDMAMQYKIWIVVIPVFSFSAFIWDGIFVGITASKQMRNAMIISSLFVFLPAYYITVNYWGNNSLWLSLNLFLISRGVIMWFMWKKMAYSN